MAINSATDKLQLHSPYMFETAARLWRFRLRRAGYKFSDIHTYIHTCANNLCKSSFIPRCLFCFLWLLTVFSITVFTVLFSYNICVCHLCSNKESSYTTFICNEQHMQLATKLIPEQCSRLSHEEVDLPTDSIWTRQWLHRPVLSRSVSSRHGRAGTVLCPAHVHAKSRTCKWTTNQPTVSQPPSPFCTHTWRHAV